MTLIDDIQEKTLPEPSTSHSESSLKLMTPTPAFRSSIFRTPFSFKAVGMGSSPGKLPAFLMITTLFCLVTLGAASPFITPEEHQPAEAPHISPEEHRPVEVPHIAPEHPAYHPEISQPHHESEEERQHRHEQPTYHPSFPRPRHEFREQEHRPEEPYHSGEQYRPEEYHPEGLHHPENHPEVHIRSPLPQSPDPLPAGAYTPSTPCPPSIEGQWNCMLTSWQRCGSGIWSAVMPTAKGTQCAPGGIAAQLKTVNAPDYPPAAEPEQPQPQPQGNTDGWGQGLPPRYSAGGRLGMSMGLAGAAVVVAVMIGGLA